MGGYKLIQNYLKCVDLNMNTNRRQFIKTAGIVGAGAGLLGLGISPAFGGVDGFADWDERRDWDGGVRFSRASPESQGVSSQSIRQFVSAAGASGISWHRFMLLRHRPVAADGHMN